MGGYTMLPRGCCFGQPGLEQRSPLTTLWVTLESSLCLSELITNSSSLPYSPNPTFKLLTYPSISCLFQGMLFQSMWICSSSHLSFWYPNIPKDASTFVISINPLPFSECPLCARKQMRRTQNVCLGHLQSLRRVYFTPYSIPHASIHTHPCLLDLESWNLPEWHTKAHPLYPQVWNGLLHT